MNKNYLILIDPVDLENIFSEHISHIEHIIFFFDDLNPITSQVHSNEEDLCNLGKECFFAEG